MSYPITKDIAFGEALKQLFAAHPLWEGAHEMYHAPRSSAIRKARNGGYYDAADEGQYWRHQLRYTFAPDWRVPPDELVALHMLIYG